MVNTDIIINTMKGWVEDKIPISPAQWVDAAAKLNIFLGDENGKLYTLEHEIAVKKCDLLVHPNMTVARAKAIVEADEQYKEYRIQGAKVKQIQEFVRIAKKQATLSSAEFSGY